MQEKSEGGGGNTNTCAKSGFLIKLTNDNVGMGYMKFKTILVALCILPGMAVAAERPENARVGIVRASGAVSRAPNVTNVTGMKSGHTTTVATAERKAAGVAATAQETALKTAEADPATCRDAYRACMDEFCLLDESEGYRCACSDNISQSKPLIVDIQKIQAEAETLYTTGVERERLGAKAKLVFGESEAAKKVSRATGLSFSQWVNSNGEVSDELGSDADIGDGLYSMAADFCADKLAACGQSGDMESALYSRQITQDCKAFNTYLTAQKKDAETNKRTAEAAVRAARLKMLDTTNKYNRGECLLAYKSCISDKGGCGANFENCLDAELLGRRANVCENVLDQCLAVRDYVLQDWAAESKMVLTDAVVYADKYQRQTCLAKIQRCLEDGCSTSTETACLTNINVAAGICPIIDECDKKIPGLRSFTKDKLSFMRVQFCQNDINKCLQDKCGKNYDAPECLNKKTSQIVSLCPQTMFPSCKGETQYNIIVQSAMLQMDYQMVQGCVNHFSNTLNAACGTDMSCLPADTTVTTMTAIPATDSEMAALREKVRADSKTAVNNYFKKFEKDITVAACKSSGANLGSAVFNTAKLIAESSAENRAIRALDSRVAELSKKLSIAESKQNCLTKYVKEVRPEGKAGTFISSEPAYEENLRNCHVCRTQFGYAEGGEDKNTTGLKTAGSGLATGAAAGTMIMPGWGTAIGAVVGGVGGFFAGKATGKGIEESPFEVTSCEDINM